METKISLAPLQGYTDWVFRGAYEKYFGAVDEFYSPYLVFQNDGSLKRSHRREVEPRVEREANLVPQILCGTVPEFRELISYLKGLGYTRVNWNLGCPYPMVVRKMRGSGLLSHPERIREILEEGMDDACRLSVKMRLGYQDDREIFKVLEVLNDFPLEEVIVHPRIGKQLYKGAVNLDRFSELFNSSSHPIAYNGDINTVEDFQVLKDRFPEVNHWMIGRGILKDLWLPDRIKQNELPSEESRKKVLMAFHDTIYQTYFQILSGDAQVLMKLKPFWEYFAFHFEDPRKVFKTIKKAPSLSKYHQAVDNAFYSK